jgi:hypothetical protein
MAWTPVVVYSYENHAALDESGKHNNGIVRLPGPDKWVDAPNQAMPTAILYDNPESMITVPPSPTLAGWPGFRVDIIFQPAAYTHRLDLVEGDLSFAFFVEPDGSLWGTVFDGTEWYPVSSAPNTIVAGRLYRAQFIYDPASTLTLYLNGGLLAVAGSNGAAVRPVQAAGIKVGYWPGGDSRYTYAGLMGPMGIYTLDPYKEGVRGIGKFVCPDSGPGTDIFNTLGDVAANMLTPQERSNTAAFYKTTVDAACSTLQALMTTSSNSRATAIALGSLSTRMRALLRNDQQAGTSIIDDPEFFNLMRDAQNLIDATSPTAKDAFLTQVMRVISALPMPYARLMEIIAAYPELQKCASGHMKGSGGTGDPLGGWPCANMPQWPAGWPMGCGPSGSSTGSSTGSGASGGTGTGSGSGSGNGGRGGGSGGAGSGGTGGGDAGGCTSNVHVHVHCCDKEGKG